MTRSLCKGLTVLKRILLPLLLQDQLDAVFGAICSDYAKEIATQFAALTRGPAWERDIRAILACLEEMPAARELKGLQPLEALQCARE